MKKSWSVSLNSTFSKDKFAHNAVYNFKKDALNCNPTLLSSASLAIL